MELGLGGKVALVAAASRGLGRAIAFELAREGAKVVMCARTRDALEAARAEIVGATGAEVHAYRFSGTWFDIGRPDDYAAASEHFERRRDEFLPDGG